MTLEETHAFLTDEKTITLGQIRKIVRDLNREYPEKSKSFYTFLTAVWQEIIATEEKKATHQVLMLFESGDTSWLEVIKGDGVIHFVRNADGVHAYHCNNLEENDYRILEIKELK